MDYKQGVEFSVFKDHPNCEKLFLDETDFSLAADMIGDFAETINLRSTLLKKAPGYTSIEEYNRAFPDTPLPYLVLIIDEVQRLFSGNYQQKDYFIKTLDFVLREGRSYGLHIILATQTLAGSGVDKNLMSQMQLRLSFKLGRQADAETIFGFHNDAPLHLDSSRFELIVNTGSGRKEANTICRPGTRTSMPVTQSRPCWTSCGKKESCPGLRENPHETEYRLCRPAGCNRRLCKLPALFAGNCRAQAKTTAAGTVATTYRLGGKQEYFSQSNATRF